MPTRNLPNTDAQRSLALQRASTKAAATLAADRPFSAAIFTLLGTTKTAWDGAIVAKGISLGGQTTSTETANLAFIKSARLVSHFLQALNMCIERDEMAATARSSYQVPMHQESVPEINSEADLTLWAGRVKDGEVARVNAGGTAIALPTVATVNAAYDDFDAKRIIQSGMSGTQDDNEEVVDGLRPATDSLILDLWDETEFTYRHESPSSLRGKAREWGVVYVQRPGEPPEGPTVPAKAVITNAVFLAPDTIHVTAHATGATTMQYLVKGPGAVDFAMAEEGDPDVDTELAGLLSGVNSVKAIGVNDEGPGPESDVRDVTVP